MIEQHDQPIGWLQCLPVALPAGRGGVREVTVEQPGCCGSDRRVAGQRCGRVTGQDEVVGEHHSMAGLDREDLVSRVGVEGDERQR